MLLLSTLSAYSRLTNTRAASVADAVQEFRERQSRGLEPADPAIASAAPGEAPPASAAQGQPQTQPEAGATQAGPDCDWACPSSYAPPEYGVYEYRQCGRSSGQCVGTGDPPATEQIGAISRDFPPQGQRIVASGGEDNRWNNVHIYSQEHREEFELTIDRAGVYNHRYKVDITVAGYTNTTDIRQIPPLQLNRFPTQERLAWGGHWNDPNGTSDADYTASVLRKEELKIEGKPVRTWVIETRIKLLGPKTRGDVTVVLWVDPISRVPVQETYDQDIVNERNVRYRAKWMVTLVSLQPSK